MSSTLLKNNKTNLNKTLSSILKGYSTKDILPERIQTFIIDICKEIPRFNKLANVEGIKVCLKNLKVGARNVKMFHFLYGSKYVPIPKNKIVEGLFPKKKKEKTDSDKVTLVRQALRNIITPQIEEYRTTVKFPCICTITHNTLVHWGQIHVDHFVPFVEMVENWLIANDLYYDEIVLKGSVNNKDLKDPSLRQSWYDYHLQNAKLRVTFKKANMSRGKDTFEGTNRATRF